MSIFFIYEFVLYVQACSTMSKLSHALLAGIRRTLPVASHSKPRAIALRSASRAVPRVCCRTPPSIAWPRARRALSNRSDSEQKEGENGDSGDTALRRWVGAKPSVQTCGPMETVVLRRHYCGVLTHLARVAQGDPG